MRWYLVCVGSFCLCTMVPAVVLKLTFNTGLPEVSVMALVYQETIFGGVPSLLRVFLPYSLRYVSLLLYPIWFGILFAPILGTGKGGTVLRLYSFIALQVVMVLC